MYQPPKLTFVGNAREVVLGVVDVGFDADGSAFPPEMEYEPDFWPLPPVK